METHQRKTLNYIENIQGVGVIRARQYYDKLTRIKALNPAIDYTEKATRRVVYNHSDALGLSTDTLYDLEYNPERVIPREKITEFGQVFGKLLGEAQFFIGGSYSRGQPSSGDIDLMIIGDRDYLHKQLMAPLLRKKQVLPLITLGENRATTYLVSEGKYYRLDIFLTAVENVVFMRTYLVGSGRFNLFMRAAAKRKGLVLNQYGLYKKTEGADLVPVKINTEQELFTHLGMKWVEYPDRNI